MNFKQLFVIFILFLQLSVSYAGPDDTAFTNEITQIAEQRIEKFLEEQQKTGGKYNRHASIQLVRKISAAVISKIDVTPMIRQYGRPAALSAVAGTLLSYVILPATFVALDQHALAAASAITPLEFVVPAGTVWWIKRKDRERLQSLAGDVPLENLDKIRNEIIGYSLENHLLEVALEEGKKIELVKGLTRAQESMNVGSKVLQVLELETIAAKSPKGRSLIDYWAFKKNKDVSLYAIELMSFLRSTPELSQELAENITMKSKAMAENLQGQSEQRQKLREKLISLQQKRSELERAQKEFEEVHKKLTVPQRKELKSKYSQLAKLIQSELTASETLLLLDHYHHQNNPDSDPEKSMVWQNEAQHRLTAIEESTALYKQSLTSIKSGDFNSADQLLKGGLAVQEDCFRVFGQLK
jgi:TolA-binding protein